MEEQVQDRPGFFGRLRDMFVREEEVEEEAGPVMDRRAVASVRAVDIREAYKYQVTVRRQIVSFDDALAAAEGLKAGVQQVLNLTQTEPSLREKIKDFMCGVNFSQEGVWEEIGDHIYLVVPAGVFVDVAPASPRSMAGKN